MLKFTLAVVYLFCLAMWCLFTFHDPIAASAIYVAVVALSKTRKGPIMRWYLFRSPWLRVFLHRIDERDTDRYPHNHPWAWARSLILRGGYLEYRHGEIAILQRSRTSRSGFGAYEWFEPGNWSALSRDDYHRIEDVREGTWTLFVAGPQVQEWGYLTPNGHVNAETT